MFAMYVMRSKFPIEPPSSNIERTLMHLLLFTNSAQRELVSICTVYTEYTQPQLTFLALHSWVACISKFMYLHQVGMFAMYVMR